MKKIVTLALLVILGFGSKVQAQHGKFIGSYNVPGIPFTTLAKLLDTLNYYGVKGPVTIELLHNETAPSGGYLLGSDSLQLSLSPANSLTINGNGYTLTAPVGTGSTDAIFKVQGADYVTIKSMNLVENSANTTATSMMEWGYAVVRRNPRDAVNTLTIQTSKISLNKTNTTAASGASPLGSTGIFIGSCLPNATALLSAPGVDSGAHSGIFLYKDTIENATNGIYANGSLTPIDGVAYNDNGLTVQENQVQNFTYNGIFLSYFHNALVKGNYVNNMGSGGVAPVANSLWGIRYATAYATAYNNGWTCDGNNVKLTINTPAGGYHVTGISSQNKGTGINTINNNIVELASTGASAQLNGIFCQNSNGSQSITGNLVHNFVTPATNAQAVIGIFSGGYCTYTGLGVSDVDGYPVAATMSNNTIDSFNVASGPASALTSVFGCQDDNMTANASPFIGNTVSNINILATSNSFIAYGGVYRRNNSALLRTTTITNNTVTKIAAVGTGNGTPLLIIRPTGPYPGAHTINLVNNKISKITAVTGRLTIMDADDGLALNISKDTISELSGGFHVLGFLTANSGVATKTIQMDNCSISALRSTSLKNGALVAGMYILPGTTATTQSVTINSNTIYNLVNDDTLGAAFGVNAAGGTATYTVYNNSLSDIMATAATASYNSSFGLSMQGTGVNKLFYNTLNLKSGATAGTGYGATGILFNAGGTNTIQNNIVRANVLAGPLNNVAAMRSLSGAALSAPSTSGFTASNNIYFAPTGSNNYLYVEGTTNATLVNGYNISGLTANATKNIVNDTFFNSGCNKSSYHQFMNAATPTREKGTYTEDNLIGSNGNYAPTGTSYAEAGALDIGIADDIAKVARPAGSSDIGAREFSGTVLPKMNIVVTSSSGRDTACTLNLPSLTASVPSYFNRVSYQWYKDATRIAGATKTKLDVDMAGGTYIVKVYDSVTGCEYAAAGFKMTVIPPPAAFITYYDSLVFCETSAVVLFGNEGPGYTYQWFKDGIALPTETKDHYLASSTGSYTVEVNTPLGCPSLSELIKVKVYPLPKPTIFWAGPGVLSTQKYYTYQWYKNNIKIDSFARGQSYFVMEDGAYTVEVTDSNGCTSKSTVYLFTLGIGDPQLAASVNIFPNPSAGKVYIQSPVTVYVELTDVTGRVVLARSDRNEADLGNCAEGVYLLSVTDKEGRLLRKEKIIRIKQ